MKIDKTDQTIINALINDARCNYSSLSKKAGVSKEVAKYRVERLEKNNIIKGYRALIDYSRLGYLVFKILIKYKDVSLSLEKQIIAYLDTLPCRFYHVTYEGAWDLHITFYAKHFSEFLHVYHLLFSEYGSHFNNKELLIPSECCWMFHKFFAESQVQDYVRYDYTVVPIIIDPLSRKIIIKLARDVRASFTEVGKELGLNYLTVADRFKSLQKSKVYLGSTARINYQKIGYRYFVLFVNLENPSIQNKIISYYKQHPACVSIMSIIGAYSLQLEILMEKNLIKKITDDFIIRFGSSVRNYEIARRDLLL